jgi:hypothetical protein
LADLSDSDARHCSVVATAATINLSDADRLDPCCCCSAALPSPHPIPTPSSSASILYIYAYIICVVHFVFSYPKSLLAHSPFTSPSLLLGSFLPTLLILLLIKNFV